VVIFAFFRCVQLDLIVDLLGSPPDEDIRSACEPAKAYVRSKGHLSSKMAALYQLSPDCDDFVMHLMCQMLTFNPVFDQFCDYYKSSLFNKKGSLLVWVDNTQHHGTVYAHKSNSNWHLSLCNSAHYYD